MFAQHVDIFSLSRKTSIHQSKRKKILNVTDIQTHIMLLELSTISGTVMEVSVNMRKRTWGANFLTFLRPVLSGLENLPLHYLPGKGIPFPRSPRSSQFLPRFTSSCYNCANCSDHKPHFISLIIQNESEILLGDRCESNRPMIHWTPSGRQEILGGRGRQMIVNFLDNWTFSSEETNTIC